MSCPVDIEVYNLKCRVPVYGKVWNAWLWLRTTTDLPSDPAERLKRIQNELAMYYGGWAYDVQITLLEGIPPGPIQGHTTFRGPDGKLVTRNKCPIPMSLVGSDFHPVFVRFVPLETEGRPWPALSPVFGSGGLQMAGGCPTGASWLLDRVLTTSDAEVPKAPEGFLEHLSKGTLSGRELIPHASDVIKAVIIAGILWLVVEIARTARAFARDG